MRTDDNENDENRSYKKKSSSNNSYLTYSSIVAMAILVSGFSFLPQAFAAPPANDDFDSATLVGLALPFSDSLNTIEATTAAGDPDCAGNGPTVWYAFTPAQDIEVRAITFGSDYDTTLSVYTGSRGSLTQIACNDDLQGPQSSVIFNAIAGQTYFLMVGSFASGPGGNLVFSMDVAPPLLAFNMTIDSAGKVDPKTGTVTISGTVTCSREVPVFVFMDLKQTIGRAKGEGAGFVDLTCTGQTKWTSSPIQSSSLLFTGGRADVHAFAGVFDELRGEFIGDEESKTVRLVGRAR
jgi:hypothetical protein